MDENARQELAMVLASPAFRGSPKLSTLLQYLSNQQPGSLTQTVIATEFFGRSCSEYDAKADSLVRTEIRRLRLKLAEYYMGEGCTSNTGGSWRFPRALTLCCGVPWQYRLRPCLCPLQGASAI